MVVQLWFQLDDCFQWAWQVSCHFLGQLIVDSLLVRVWTLVMEIHFVDSCVWLSLESGSWLVALWVGWVESVDLVLASVVKGPLLH